MAQQQPKGTVAFTTVGRVQYGFDVFYVTLHNQNNHYSAVNETRLTDGVSINFNAQFVDDEEQSIVFVSERNGSPKIYLTRIGDTKPELLSYKPGILFYDRPVLKKGKTYFISAHEDPGEKFKSWSALYAASDLDKNEITRLTPEGHVDYSPSVSQSGRLIAVASYGSKTWGGEFHELKTDIVVFEQSDPEKRVIVCEHGGWPTWCGDETIYFHRQATDGWWSIFHVDFNLESSGFPTDPVRVTPPGVHCFTPAAFQDGKRIAVATRRRDKEHRHIEVFDADSKEFYPVTELINENLHHYSPFVSSDSLFLGYHRFRGESTRGDSTVPNFEPVGSPIRNLTMLRLNGNFPAFSPDGDLVAFNPDFEANGSIGIKIVKSDGSKRWTLVKNRLAFCNTWSPTEKHVIYTSIGPIFEAARTTVQVARVSFDPSDLTNYREEITCNVKILTKEDTGNNAFPSCSPDGKSLVFRSGRTGHKNLYIIDAVNGEFDGGSIRQLTNGPWIDTMASWSPKGDVIAFSSNMHNPNNPDCFSIYLIKPDGSDLKRVYVAGVEGSNEVDRERNNHVCFSEDGEWILFTANMAGVLAEPVSWPNQFQPYGDMYVARSDGSELKRLTWNGYENGTPGWHSGVEVDISRLSLGSKDEEKLKAKLCPDAQKQKELIDTFNASLQSNYVQDSKKGKGKAANVGRSISNPKLVAGGNNSYNLADNIIASVRELQSGYKPAEEETEVLKKDGYRSTKGKLKAPASSNSGPSTETGVQNNLSSVAGGSDRNLVNGGKQQKKTSKFHRAQLGDGSMESLLDLKKYDHDPDPDPLESSSNGNQNPGQKLPIRSVWGKGGGQKLFS